MSCAQPQGVLTGGGSEAAGALSLFAEVVNAALTGVGYPCPMEGTSVAVMVMNCTLEVSGSWPVSLG